MKLRFGKFKGFDIIDVDVDYLKWVEENVTSLTEMERKEINIEIERKTGDRSSIGVERRHFKKDNEE